MKLPSDQLDGFLLRVLVAVTEEKSVSRAAARLNLPQSTVSAGLNRLRTIFNDPMFVRGRNSMVPTARMEELYERIRSVAADLEDLCVPEVIAAPEAINREFHIGTLDYISSSFIPHIIARLLQKMPRASIQVHALSLDFDYQESLETGALDLMIGNWGTPPEHLHLYPLFEDEIVCLSRPANPVLKGGFDQADYLAADHLGLLPVNGNQLGVIDAYLAQMGLRRNVKVVLPYFNNVPNLLLKSDLIFTTCRRFAEEHSEDLPLQIVPSPIPFPSMKFYLLWHERTHRSYACKEMRDCVVEACSAMIAPETDRRVIQLANKRM